MRELTSDVPAPRPIYLDEALTCHQEYPLSASEFPWAPSGEMGLLLFQIGNNNNNTHFNDDDTFISVDYFGCGNRNPA